LVISKTVIEVRLRKLEECVRRLRQSQGISEEDFLKSYKDQDVVDRNLQLAAEVIFDIANHIIAEKGFELPNSLEETLPILQKHQILSEELGQRLKGLGRFRNLLVHEYLTIDYHRVYSYLKNNLPDFESFAKEIMVFLALP